jgi:hypothetical protein
VTLYVKKAQSKDIYRQPLMTFARGLIFSPAVWGGVFAGEQNYPYNIGRNQRRFFHGYFTGWTQKNRRRRHIAQINRRALPDSCG